MYNFILQKGSLGTLKITGIVISIPKIELPNTVRDYRSTALLNRDYKILTSVTQNRLRPILTEVQHLAQSYSAPVRTILETVGRTKDTKMHAELKVEEI
jgi:hypothetical protein